MLKGFREFIMRGNVIDLAVGIVIGAAFGKVIDAFVTSFVDPLVRLVLGGDKLSGTWRVTDAVTVDWAAFVNALITFTLTAAVIYFVVITPMNRWNHMRRRGKPAEPDEVSDEVRLLTEIRDAVQADRR